MVISSLVFTLAVFCLNCRENHEIKIEKSSISVSGNGVDHFSEGYLVWGRSASCLVYTEQP